MGDQVYIPYASFCNHLVERDSNRTRARSDMSGIAGCPHGSRLELGEVIVRFERRPIPDRILEVGDSQFHLTAL